MSEEAAGAPPERERQLGIFEDKILTVPNVISLARLACVPIFLWLLFSQDDRWAAAWLWGGIGANDWVDGWWARKYDVVSEFGKFIDPLTDRVALIVPILAIAVDGAVPWWLVIVTLTREGLVAIAGVAQVRLRVLGRRRLWRR